MVRNLVLVLGFALLGLPQIALAQTSFDASGAGGGSIIVGADTDTCDGTKAGAIRYNSGNSCAEFCDGTAWTCPSCAEGGLNFGGSCWYTGLAAQSCTQVCSTRGGYSDETEAFAGSGGSSANCEALMTAFSGASSASYTGDVDCGALGGGCVYRESTSSTQRCSTPATTAGASQSGHRRICACNK